MPRCAFSRVRRTRPEHHPHGRIGRVILEAVRLALGDEQQITGREVHPRRATHELALASHDDVHLITVVRGLRIRVGRALIEHVYARAAEAGASRVWWLTHESNAQAMLLYDRIADKSGFVQYRKVL